MAEKLSNPQPRVLIKSSLPHLLVEEGNTHKVITLPWYIGDAFINQKIPTSSMKFKSPYEVKWDDVKSLLNKYSSLNKDKDKKEDVEKWIQDFQKNSSIQKENASVLINALFAEHGYDD